MVLFSGKAGEQFNDSQATDDPGSKAPQKQAVSSKIHRPGTYGDLTPHTIDQENNMATVRSEEPS